MAADSDSDKKVTITLNGSGLPVASPDPVQIQKNTQKVKWCAAFPFSIELEGSTENSSPAGGDCANKLHSRTFANTGNIKYSITANNQTNDPVIEVIP